MEKWSLKEIREESVSKILDCVLGVLKKQYTEFFLKGDKKDQENSEYQNFLQESPLNIEETIRSKLLGPVSELIGIHHIVVHVKKGAVDTHIQIGDDTLYFMTKLEYVGTDNAEVVAAHIADGIIELRYKHHFALIIHILEFALTMRVGTIFW